jgi:hypothetical protein
MPRVDDADSVAPESIHVPGIYAGLLARELDRPADPRLTALGVDGPVQASPLLVELQAGRPVILPVWALGGHSEPDARIRRVHRDDRTITAWRVTSDDLAMPVRQL